MKTAVNRFTVGLRIGEIMIFVAIMGVFALGTEPALAQLGYSVIAQRNPFGLNPVPRPVPKTEQVFLTGITSIGTPRAWFVINPGGGKLPEYFSLGPGEKRGAVEVIAIDLKNGSVNVRNFDLEATITFASHDLKAARSSTDEPRQPPKSLPHTISPEAGFQLR
jgi:hypothetical protein